MRGPATWLLLAALIGRLRSGRFPVACLPFDAVDLAVALARRLDVAT